MANILLIEDDETLRFTIARALKKAAYEVVDVASLPEARNAFAAGNFDLVLTDVNLGAESGIDFVEELRGLGYQGGVVVMTAFATVDDAVRAMKLGADDYLAKPFEPKELLLRINAILRRVPAAEPVVATQKVLNLGPVRYDIERGEMWRGEELVRLTSTESQLMRIFSGVPSEPVTRAKLVEELSRSGGQTQERAVDVQITRLRRKIEEDPKQPRYLQTVRGAGYMLAPDQV